MEQTKPYSLQSPEAIAKKYGGDKRKIARAAQMGMVDPTAATVAGMFIDRMRLAAVEEQTGDQTVAGKVFAPQIAQVGLPAAPGAQMAQQMPTQMGAAPQSPDQPMPQPVMTAADGGYMEMNEGLMSINVPEDMYNYGGGGIVAFAAGTPGHMDPDFLSATGLSEADFGTKPVAGLGAIAPAADETEDEYEKRYKKELAMRKKYLGETSMSRDEARNMAMLQAGLGILGGTSPYAFQNVSTGALPAVAQYSKDIRSIKEDEAKALEAAFKRQADIEEKKLAAGKTTELDRAAGVFLRGLGAQGYDITNPQIQAAAYEMAFSAKGMSEFKGELSTAQDRQARYELANKETNSILSNTKSGPGLEYFLATQRDAANKKAGKPSNEAAVIRQRVMDEQLSSIPDPSKPRSTGMFKLPDLAKPEPKVAPEAPAAPSASAPAAPKAAAAKPAGSQINTGKDLTSSRLTGKDLAAQKEKFNNDPAINKRLDEAEAEAKRVIAEEKNPKKVTSQKDYDNLPKGTVYVLPNGEKGIKDSEPSIQSAQPKKTPPGLQKPPDLSTIKGVPKGATYGTYVAGKGWQVIAQDPKTGQLQVIGHIDPTKQLAKPKE